jgi:hypothetical protein
MPRPANDAHKAKDFANFKNSVPSKPVLGFLGRKN